MRKNVKLLGVLAVCLAAATMLYFTGMKSAEANPGTEVTVSPGEYGSPFSYWGFEKSGAYTTIRLQSQSGHPIATYTFEELPVRIKLAGNVYEIKEVDNTKLVVETIQ